MVKLMLSKQIGLMFIFLVLAAPTRQSFAGNTVRDQEMAQCLQGEISTWGDGQDRPAVSSPLVFIYNHVSAPAWFDVMQVLATVKMAAQAWSQCGVPSSVVSWPTDVEVQRGAILVQWSEPGSRGNFGLANVGERTLSLGPSAFELLRTRNPSFDSRQTLQMVISHEMGHLFGLMAHSRRCVDVTSYYNDAKGNVCSIRDGRKLQPGVEYRSVMPTACDIQRCRLVNRKPVVP